VQGRRMARARVDGRRVTSIRATISALGFTDGEFVQLAAIRERNIVARTFVVGDDAAAEAWAHARSAEGADLYICGNPPKTKLETKASQEDVAKVRVLLLDFDPEKT